MREEIFGDWANPSSPHLLGNVAASKLSIARENICEFLDCASSSLVFTSGATESINTVLHPENIKAHGIQQIVSSKLEHSATLNCVERLERAGIPIKWISSDENGVLNLSELDRHISGVRSLVSVMYVNNETGVINDIPAISKIVSKSSSLLHVDASQALGKLQFSVSNLNAHFVSLSGHKIGSFKGVGALIVSEPINLSPLIGGGGQERGIRAGTSNLPGIRSFELAIQDVDFEKINSLKLLRDELETRLTSINSRNSITARSTSRVANTSNVFLAGRDSQEALLYLSSKGIFASNGSACNSGSVEPSHVLTGLGFSRDYAKSCIRFSLGPENTLDQIQKVANELDRFLNSSNSEDRAFVDSAN